MKITAFNLQTRDFQEKVLTPEMGILGRCIIGRHPNCDLVLNSPEVSRTHGIIILLQDGKYGFLDLCSTDGSRVNGEEILDNQLYILKPDDMISIGRFFLQLTDLEVNESTFNQKLLVNKIEDQSKWTQRELSVRCVQVIDETHDVKTFRFVADPEVKFSYKPGQFVTLTVEIDGKQVPRCYSISSTPSRPNTLEITVKRVPDGLVSNWLHDNIKVGTQVKLNSPTGNFTCSAKPSEKLLFISAGSGITPMMSMSRWLCDTDANFDVIFVQSARSPRDIIFRQELELMVTRHPNFKLAVTLTRSEPGQVWMGYTGRLNEVMLQAIAPDFRDRTVYVCGPNPFMEGIETMLQGLNFPMQNYFFESFGGSSKKPGKPSQQSPSESVTNGDYLVPSPTSSQSIVVFADSGKEVACDGTQSILEVAEQEKIPLPYGCKMGGCGMCKLPLLEGEVNYDGKTPKCEEGYVLTCIAKPVGRVKIEA